VTLAARCTLRVARRAGADVSSALQSSQQAQAQAQAQGGVRGAAGYSMYRSGSGMSAHQQQAAAYGQNVGAAMDSMRNMHVSGAHHGAANGHLMPR
jgi:hypothetical protein